MRTAIFTTAPTTLTIETSETLQLEQMGGAAPVRLTHGRNTVQIGRGVFRLVSMYEVRVAAESSDAHVMSTMNDKDGDFPEPQKADELHVDRGALREFFQPSARSL
jgi:hypothetical protein